MQPLSWPDCRNTRDLGGLPLRDGGEVRSRALIRSDNLDQLTPAGLAAVESCGVSRFVDLRSTWECETFRSPYAADPRWCNHPLSDPADPEVADPDLFVQYRVLLDDYPNRIRSAVIALADAPPGAVVVNCHAGKDRTGVVVALVLELLGVPRSIIAADYAASTASADTMLRLLAYVDETYDGVAGYLRCPEMSQRLRDRLIR